MIPKEFLKSHRQFADSVPQVMPLSLESANAVGAAHENLCLVDEKLILFFIFYQFVNHSKNTGNFMLDNISLKNPQN